MKVEVVFWSQMGHTEEIAGKVAEAVKDKGYDVSVSAVADADKNSVLAADIVLLGCPAMGDEELDQDDFQPFYDEIKSSLKAKVGLFGSYEWNVGEWMVKWEKDAKESGLNVLATFPIHESEMEEDYSDKVNNFVSKF